MFAGIDRDSGESLHMYAERDGEQLLGRMEEASLQGLYLKRLASAVWDEWHEWHRQARLAGLPTVEWLEDALMRMYDEREGRQAEKGHLTRYDLLETLYQRYRDEKVALETVARREPHNDGRGTSETRLLVNGTETRAARRWQGSSRKRLEGLKRRDGTPFIDPFERKQGKDRAAGKSVSVSASRAADTARKLHAVGGTAILTSK